MEIKVVFMGSPEFALPTLRSLAQEYRVVGVVTQPDKPAGRGRQMVAPLVKNLAVELSLPVIQPPRLKAPEAMAQIEAWAPDLIVVAAFGQILRQNLLDLPRYGCINVHASLLPRWRGAAPIQAAILHGDQQTGVTIMKMDAGLDTGPVLNMRALNIEASDNSQALSGKLAVLGSALLMETLPGYLSGSTQPQPQPEEGMTYAPMLKKEEGVLDFTRPAAALECQVRAFNPWPGAVLSWPGGELKVLRARVALETALSPGQRLVYHKVPAVAAVDGLLVLEEVQPPGKTSMPGKAFLNGVRNWVSP